MAPQYTKSAFCGIVTELLTAALLLQKSLRELHFTYQLEKRSPTRESAFQPQRIRICNRRNEVLSKEVRWRAVAALRAQGDLVAAKILEEELLITGFCQYCEKELKTPFETITLCDTCEECHLVEGIHPATLRKRLVDLLKQYEP